MKLPRPLPPDPCHSHGQGLRRKSIAPVNKESRLRVAFLFEPNTPCQRSASFPGRRTSTAHGISHAGALWSQSTSVNLCYPYVSRRNRVLPRLGFTFCRRAHSPPVHLLA